MKNLPRIDAVYKSYRKGKYQFNEKNSRVERRKRKLKKFVQDTKIPNQSEPHDELSCSSARFKMAFPMIETEYLE